VLPSLNTGIRTACFYKDGCVTTFNFKNTSTLILVEEEENKKTNREIPSMSEGPPSTKRKCGL
jgi:hypothetical protein